MPVSLARMVQSTLTSVGVGVVKTDAGLGGTPAAAPTAGAGLEASVVSPAQDVEEEVTGGEGQEGTDTATAVSMTTTIHRTSTRIVTVFTATSAGMGAGVGG